MKILILLLFTAVSLVADTNEHDAKAVEHIAGAVNKQTAAQYKIIMTKMANDKELALLERKVKERKATMLQEYNASAQAEITTREIARFEAQVKLAEINRSYDLKSQDSKQNFQRGTQDSKQNFDLNTQNSGQNFKITDKTTVNADKNDERKFALEEKKLEMQMKLAEMKLKLAAQSSSNNRSDDADARSDRRRIQRKIDNLDDEISDWRKALSSGNASESTVNKNIDDLTRQKRKLENEL